MRNLMSKTRQAGIWEAIRKAGGLKAMGLRTPHLVVLLCMADHENEATGKLNVGSQTVAEETDQDASRVRKLRSQLRKMGYIKENSRVKVKVGYNIYWGWDEERLPRASGNLSYVAQGNDDPSHRAPQAQEPSLKKSKINRKDSASDSSDEEELTGEVKVTPLQQRYPDGPEEQWEKPTNEPPGVVSGSVAPVEILGEAPIVLISPVTTVRNKAPTNSDRDPPATAPEPGPTLPCLLLGLDLLRTRLKNNRPTRKETWQAIEARLKDSFTEQDLDEFGDALRWSFTRRFWVEDVFQDPRKQDLIGVMFSPKTVKKMMEDRAANHMVHLNTEDSVAPKRKKPQARAQKEELDDREQDEHNRWG
jgi:hypothetical protein